VGLNLRGGGELGTGIVCGWGMNLLGGKRVWWMWAIEG